MSEYGITAQGFVPKPYSVILDELIQITKQELGEDIDLSEQSRFLRVLKICAKREDELWQLLEDAYYSAFIDFATGQNLDYLVAILGIRRKRAMRATGTVVFSRSSPATSDILIPAGTRVAVSDGSIVFQTTGDVVLSAGNTQVEATIEAVEPGLAGNVTANTITKIVDPISGIESVNNPNPTEGGQDAETDEELRYRAKRYAPYAKATVYSIKAAVLELEGVTDALVQEDVENHTVNVIVEGGDDSEIESTIDQSRPCGIQVTWQRPAYKTIDVTVEVKAAEGYDASAVQNGVQQAIEDYFNSLTIGRDVTFSDLSKAILNADGVDDINSLEVTDGDSTINAFGQSIAIAETEKAKTGTITVTVV